MTIAARTLRHAKQEMNRRFPDYLGVGGFVTFKDGSTYPIRW